MPLIIALIVMLWHGEMQAASKPVIMPLADGRHTIAVQCNGIWSDDLVFYWERG